MHSPFTLPYSYTPNSQPTNIPKKHTLSTHLFRLTRIHEIMASYYTHVTHISTCPHTLITPVWRGITLSCSMSTDMSPLLRFHISTQVVVVVVVLTITRIIKSVVTGQAPVPPPRLFIYLFPYTAVVRFSVWHFGDMKRLRDRRSGHSHKSCRTFVVQSTILENFVTYKDVLTHHSAVYHARVLDLLLRHIFKLPLWPTTNTCNVQPGHALYWYSALSLILKNCFAENFGVAPQTILGMTMSNHARHQLTVVAATWKNWISEHLVVNRQSWQ